MADRTVTRPRTRRPSAPAKKTVPARNNVPANVAVPAGAAEEGRRLTLPVPTVAIRRVRVPMLRPPSLPAVGSAAHAAGALPSAVRRHLPPRERTLYYAGLGALAALDLLSWPVAAAIGGGVWVASRSRGAVTT